MKRLSSTDGDYVEISVEIKAETEKAYKVVSGEVMAWIPKSMLEDDPEDIGNGLHLIIIKEWLAQEKELI